MPRSPKSGLFLLTLCACLLACSCDNSKKEAEAKLAASEFAAESAEQAAEARQQTIGLMVQIIAARQGEGMALAVKAGEALVIDVACNVYGASVFADGRFVGHTEATYQYGKETGGPDLTFALRIPHGGRDASAPHTIKVTKRGYRPFAARTYLNKREIDIHVKLVK